MHKAICLGWVSLQGLDYCAFIVIKVWTLPVKKASALSTAIAKQQLKEGWAQYKNGGQISRYWFLEKQDSRWLFAKQSHQGNFRLRTKTFCGHSVTQRIRVLGNDFILHPEVPAKLNSFLWKFNIFWYGVSKWNIYSVIYQFNLTNVFSCCT